MKKMLFSAIAMVAFAGSAFASNEVVMEAFSIDNVNEETPEKIHPKVICNATIVYYDGLGRRQEAHYSETYYFVSDLMAVSKCNIFADSMAAKHKTLSPY